MAKTYGQFCALARSLEHVGDRWTLLIVRELLIGAASYGDLQAALEGIPTNLLADRLRGLQADGIVERVPSDADRRRASYSLTPLGEGLAPAVDALIVWGGHWMSAGPGNDRFDPRWASLALRALLADRRAAFSGTVELRFGNEVVRVTGTQEPLGGSGRSPVRATLYGPAEVLLAVASGDLALDAAEEAGVVAGGDVRTLRRLLERPPGRPASS